jgi:hypothetical protein
MKVHKSLKQNLNVFMINQCFDENKNDRSFHRTDIKLNIIYKLFDIG